MIKRLFICERPYPLYRTLIKCINDSQYNDIVISNHVEGMDKMYSVLADTTIFRHVFFYDDVMYKKFYSFGNEREFSKFPSGVIILLKKLKMYIELQNKAKDITLSDKINIEDYDEIYVNDATSTIMFYLCSKKKKFIWVEHAKNVFQLKLSLVYRICFRVMPILEKLGIAYSLHGTSKWVEAIEVNNNCNLIPLIKKKKIREVNIDKILEKMSEKDKNFIFELYCKAYSILLDKAKSFSIILTAPLFLDGLVQSEEEQIRVYKNLIKREIGENKSILIKPHPRDKIKYEQAIPGVIVVDNCISAEIFNLAAKGCIEGAYGIRTTTVDAFTNVKYKKSYSKEQIKVFL